MFYTHTQWCVDLTVFKLLLEEKKISMCLIKHIGLYEYTIKETTPALLHISSTEKNQYISGIYKIIQFRF